MSGAEMSSAQTYPTPSLAYRWRYSCSLSKWEEFDCMWNVPFVFKLNEVGSKTKRNFQYNDVQSEYGKYNLIWVDFKRNRNCLLSGVAIVANWNYLYEKIFKNLQKKFQKLKKKVSKTSKKSFKKQIPELCATTWHCRSLPPCLFCVRCKYLIIIFLQLFAVIDVELLSYNYRP